MMLNANNIAQKAKEMNLDIVAFAQLVRQMRHNQRRYINIQRPDIKQVAERYENEVDNILKALFDAQQKLF